MTDAITFSIPCLPAYALSPNSREHWATKSAESRAARSTAQLAWFNHRFDTGQPPISGPVALTWTVFLPKRGKPRDIDNLIPCMKPLLDGLVDGLVIAGDTPDIVRRVDVAQVPWAEHKGEPMTCVTIEPVEHEPAPAGGAGALGGGMR